MPIPYPNFADKPRYKQRSTVRDLVIIPFGFTVNNSGAIAAQDNANPPQVYAVAGANNQTYTLKCPAGNPAKVWAFIHCGGDRVAAVTSYSTITSGTLTIALSSAPADGTLIKGYIAYGRNFGEGKGAVLAAPSEAQEIAAFGQHEVKSVLKQAAMLPLSWTIGASNAVTETRGPLGAAVEPQGSGVYWLGFDHRNPANFPANWAVMFGASDGRRANLTHSAVTALGRKLHIVTFVNTTNMASGDRATLLCIGSPADFYAENYGGASGGVHSNLETRDIGTYGHFPMMTAMRNSVFIPVHAAIAASTAGPTESTSNLAPNLRIVRASAGVYTLYIGKYKSSDVCCAFNLSNGQPIGPTAFGEAAGTITLTVPGGSDPGACTLSGFVIVRDRPEV